MLRFRNGILAAGAAAFLSSQAAYAAPAHSYPTIDPLVSLSALAGAPSLAAVCAGSTAAAAATTTAAANPGCVLPVTTPPPVAPVAETVAPVAPPPPGKSLGVLPLLLGLAAIIGLAALILSNGDNNKGDNVPVSPA